MPADDLDSDSGLAYLVEDEETWARTREELWAIPPEQREEAFKTFTDEEIRNLARGYANTALAVHHYLPGSTYEETILPPQSYRSK